MISTTVCLLCFPDVPRDRLEAVAAGVIEEQKVQVTHGYGNRIERTQPVRLTHLRHPDDPEHKTACGITLPEGEA